MHLLAIAAPNPSPDLLMRSYSGLEQLLCEGGDECIGPSLAFVPLRETKDCVQDDSAGGVDSAKRKKIKL